MGWQTPAFSSKAAFCVVDAGPGYVVAWEGERRAGMACGQCQTVIKVLLQHSGAHSCLNRKPSSPMHPLKPVFSVLI